MLSNYVPGFENDDSVSCLGYQVLVMIYWDRNGRAFLLFLGPPDTRFRGCCRLWAPKLA